MVLDLGPSLIRGYLGAIQRRAEEIQLAIVSEIHSQLVGAGVAKVASGTIGALSRGSIFRAGKSNPGNFKVRPGEEGVSFRNSLSNPIDAKERPVFRPGDDFVEVDVSKLPAGSAIPDNVPPGHVTVKGATPDQIKAAVTNRGKLPPD